MDTKFVLIGVGGTGVKVVDMMDIPNSKKVFITADVDFLNCVTSHGPRISLVSAICYPNYPRYLRERAIEQKEEIRRAITEA